MTPAPPLTGPPIGARLAHFKEEWFRFTDDPFVRSIVAEGVKIELEEEPCQERLPARVYSPEDDDVIAEEIKTLLEKNIVVEHLDPQQAAPLPRTFVLSYFTVPKKDGGKRSILDLREFNLKVRKRYFRLESIKTARELLRSGDYMVKIDIKDAYFHLPIHQAFRAFFRFNFRGKTYEFTCLPMGLTSSPRLFTRFMKPVIAHLRNMGHRLVIYLDDILLIASSEEEIATARDATLELLRQLGWTVNEKKSVLTPSQEIEFLGLNIDTRTMMISLPDKKRHDLAAAINDLLQRNATRTLTIREAARMLGKMSATAMAVEPARQPLLDQVRAALMRGQSWESSILLPDLVVEACRWWIHSLHAWNSRSIIPRPIEAAVVSDASPAALGATVSISKQKFRFQRHLSPEESAWTCKTYR